MPKKKKGYHNVPGMRNRRKGGRTETTPDGFDRSAPDTLASLADSWLDRLEERAYSKRTLDKTRWCLRDFLGWCQDRDLIDPATITKPILESYQRHLFHYRQKNGKPLGVTTQRDRLGALQRFFRWLCKENHLPANPAADLELPRKPAKTLPKALSADEIAALMATADTSDVLGIRDRCMLEFLYSSGLRRSELTGLDIDDVDPHRGLVTVRKGKGGKSRVLPLGDVAEHWFERYRDEARPRLELDTNERALFLSGYGTRLNPNYVGNWVKRTMTGVGIEKPGSCHLLRHSCATHMHDNGADIRFIQILLGHASLETTQIYTEVSIEKLRDVHARTHPHWRDDRHEHGGKADQS
jgi:integrase/recombinase XerD